MTAASKDGPKGGELHPRKESDPRAHRLEVPGTEQRRLEPGSHYTAESLPLADTEGAEKGKGVLGSIYFQLSPHLPSLTENVTNFWCWGHEGPQWVSPSAPR